MIIKDKSNKNENECIRYLVSRHVTFNIFILRKYQLDPRCGNPLGDASRLEMQGSYSYYFGQKISDTNNKKISTIKF